MSKAFTRETDNEDEDDLEEAAAPGYRNLITPEGLERLRAELNQLRRVERPKVVEAVSAAAANGDRSENGDYIYGKKRLREIDRRIRFLVRRLAIAEPVHPSSQSMRDQVFFGATVTFAEEDGAERVVRIVGVDETAHWDNAISWISPVARALMKARAGDVVEFRSPAGPRALEVVRIDYPDG